MIRSIFGDVPSNFKLLPITLLSERYELDRIFLDKTLGLNQDCGYKVGNGHGMGVRFSYGTHFGGGMGFAKGLWHQSLQQ
jgi:hypothetical protein